MTNILLVIFLGTVLMGIEGQLVKIGTRYESFSPVTDGKIRDDKYSTIDFKFRSKTYDTFIYQYPPDMPYTTIDTFPVDRIPSLKVDFLKKVPEDLKGLHRRIEYQVNITLADTALDLKTFAEGKCNLQVIDYADVNYYIDVEEIDEKKKFTFIENERMDIEKMNSKAKQYYYALLFPINGSNTVALDGKINIRVQADFPFHLRYGEANHAGRVLYKLPQTFDIATNCILNEDTEAEKERINNLRKIPRYNWVFNHSFKDEPIQFFNLVSGAKVQNFVVFAGHTDYKTIVKASTLVAVLYGMLVILYAMYTSWNNDLRQQGAKQKVE
jgi:hypothetical protein